MTICVTKNLRKGSLHYNYHYAIIYLKMCLFIICIVPAVNMEPEQKVEQMNNNSVILPEDHSHHHHNNNNGENQIVVDEDSFARAMDITIALASGAVLPSLNKRCVDRMKALMIRNRIPTSASELRSNLSDQALLRIGLLASIALISPWDQDPVTGLLLISDHGILQEAYHPSKSESDIMLCVVCSLLAIIIMFHITSAQQQYIVSPPPPPPVGGMQPKNSL